MGRRKKYPVFLTDEEVTHLTTLLRTGSQSAHTRRRAEILLHLDQQHGEVLPVKDIAERCGVTVPTIYTVSRQFSQEGLSDKLLYRKKHDYPPIRVTGDVEAKIIATACSEPPEGYDRWTVRLLENKIVLDDGSTLSRSTINQVLKKHR